MIFFIPNWITIAIIVLRVLRKVLAIGVEVVLLVLWASLAVLRWGYARASGEMPREALGERESTRTRRSNRIPRRPAPE